MASKGGARPVNFTACPKDSVGGKQANQKVKFQNPSKTGAPSLAGPKRAPNVDAKRGL